ncbi:MAG TPA: hypothetical protein VNO21_20735, partial [Polyangiaceae bacterium]|nr:hypothetical protein [Polyangiaceae bacterium]
AARAVQQADAGAGGDAGTDTPATVTLDNVVGADYRAYTDSQGNPVNWRSCVMQTDDNGNKSPYGLSTGPMSFVSGSLPKISGGDRSTAGLRDYYDYTTYNQSTQGHFNGTDGLCFVQRNYPSPP